VNTEPEALTGKDAAHAQHTTTSQRRGRALRRCRAAPGRPAASETGRRAGARDGGRAAFI